VLYLCITTVSGWAQRHAERHFTKGMVRA
jgi:hypothetical protein